MTDSNIEISSETPPEPQPAPSEPLLNIPRGLIAIILFMVAIYGLQALVLSAEMVNEIDFTFGFLPARYVYPLFDGDYGWVWTPLTYSFLHGSVEHLLFNCLWLACFGTPVVRRIGTARSAAFWVASSVAAAALYAGLHWGEVQLVIGASGVISAFMGAACRFAFPPRTVAFSRRPVHEYPRLSLPEVFSSKTATSFLILWLIGNVLIAFGLPLAGTTSGAIAWEAHIGGLVFGFLAFPLFDTNTPGRAD